MKTLSDIQKKGIRRRLEAFERSRRARERRRVKELCNSLTGSLSCSTRQSGPPCPSRSYDNGVWFLGRYIQDGRRGSDEPVHIGEVVKELFMQAGRGLGDA
jgi:hypothetical protein